MIYNLQVLRAVAALMVVMLHLGALPKAVGWDPVFLRVGASGVDLFFVISGFVMVHTVSRKPVGGGAFFVNRLIRVVPLYWIVTLGLAALVTALPGLFRTISASPPELFRSLAFLPYAGADGVFRPIVFAGWTLNYEMFFYAVFAIALVATRGAVRATAAAASAVLLALVVVGVALAPEGVGRFYTSPILLEFAFGMGLAFLLPDSRRPARRWGWIALIGGALALAASPVLAVHVPSVLVNGLASVAILWGAVVLERHGHVWRGRFVQLLGAASYALYLTHPYPLGVLARVGEAAGSPVLALILAVLGLAMVVGTGILVHVLVERPIGLMLRRWAGHARPVTVVADPATPAPQTQERGGGHPTAPVP